MYLKALAIVVIAATLLTALTITSSMPYIDAKKPDKPQKCNNIKILIKVNGVEENQTVVANVSLGTGMKSKSGIVEENETSITLPVNFKKISPCPAIGFGFTGDVNGTSFEGTIKSLKKPNKVTVDL